MDLQGPVLGRTTRVMIYDLGTFYKSPVLLRTKFVLIITRTALLLYLCLLPNQWNKRLIRK
jgi:hypothetical protein